MRLATNIITQISSILRYDVSQYLNRYVDFIENDRQRIFDYYKGSLNRLNIDSFNRLEQLLVDTNKVNSLVEIHKTRLSNSEFWQFIETFTEIEESLLTVDNSSKWLRSVITKNNFSPQVEVSFILKQFQTIEQLTRSLGSNDADNDWIKLALRNDLFESDYTVEGGVEISTSYFNKLSFSINSVVDNIDHEKIYGLDLDRTITFEDDDLRVLSYKETIKQTVNILASLKYGQTPEFPLDGIQMNLVSGSNKASIPYPVLFRQFYTTFQKDDTLKSLSVKTIQNIDDRLEINFEVETRLGEIVPTQTIF